MIEEQESQDRAADDEGVNYLIELLDRAKSRHNINSWEEFAALVTLRSGNQVSGNTFRRNVRKKGAWKFLSLSLLQWAAIAEITGVSMHELIRRFKTNSVDNQEESQQ